MYWRQYPSSPFFQQLCCQAENGLKIKWMINRSSQKEKFGIIPARSLPDDWEKNRLQFTFRFPIVHLSFQVTSVSLFWGTLFIQLIASEKLENEIPTADKKQKQRYEIIENGLESLLSDWLY